MTKSRSSYFSLADVSSPAKVVADNLLRIESFGALNSKKRCKGGEFFLGLNQTKVSFGSDPTIL